MVIFSIILATLMYIFMIVMNTMANTLPLNGIATGAVSFKYPNLFQPSGITFSIWGIIYILLLIFIIIQFKSMKNLHDEDVKQLFITINLLFALTSVLNGLWLFAWHYDKMILSTIIMLFLLITLIFIVKKISFMPFLSRAAFSTYLGWITIATIANITITLVKIGVPSYRPIAVLTTVVVLLVGLAISLMWIIKEKDYIFGFVIIWAFIGIFLRHIRQENLPRLYPMIISVVAICFICLLVVNSIVLSKSIK